MGYVAPLHDGECFALCVESTHNLRVTVLYFSRLSFDLQCLFPTQIQAVPSGTKLECESASKRRQKHVYVFMSTHSYRQGLWVRWVQLGLWVPWVRWIQWMARVKWAQWVLWVR